MSLQITDSVLDLAESPTIAIKAIADDMKSQGIDVYDFGVGEMNPEIPVPKEFKEGIIKALQNDETHYISPQGDPKLRKAIVDDYKANFGIEITDANVSVYAGPKDAFSKICMALLPNTPSSRNRVVAFAPVYESFTNVPFYLTGKPTVLLPTSDDDFTPDLDKLKHLLEQDENGEKSIKAVILNSPNNPAGAVYSQKFCEDFAEILKQYPHIAILSDEVYRTINYTDQKHISLYQYLPQQTIICGGISKEVSGTGVRIGFLVAPDYITKALVKLQGNISSCVCLSTMRGYAHFLEQDRDLHIRKAILERLTTKRGIMLKGFQEHEGLKDCKWIPPKGAFYFFPNVTKYFGKKTPQGTVIHNDEDLAIYILKEGAVVTIPGSKFEKPGFLRLAFASSPDERIRIGVEKMAQALQKLQ